MASCGDGRHVPQRDNAAWLDHGSDGMGQRTITRLTKNRVSDQRSDASGVGKKATSTGVTIAVKSSAIVVHTSQYVMNVFVRGS